MGKVDDMTAPPPPVRVVTGPDGRMQTEALPPVITPEQLAELHRQTMDRITGNERFHDDPHAAPPPAAPWADFPPLPAACPKCGVHRLGPCDDSPSSQCPKGAPS